MAPLSTLWLTIQYPDIPSVGRFEGDRFEAARWKATFPNRAMLNAQPDDTFWAARRVMAFSNDAIRAGVASADYSDARATEAIADVLIKRRDKIGREWLAETRPEGTQRETWHNSPRSGRNQAQFDCLLNELCVRLHAKELHDSVLVELDGSWADVEQRCHFLHRFALCQELQHFSLSRTQVPQLNLIRMRA
jgi:hypothetical protein